MLSTISHLNPAVTAAAELFTDGRLTDAVLQNVATMRGLPLFIETGAVPTITERAEAAQIELGRASADHRIVTALYAAARRRLGMANQRPAADRRAAQTAAMGALNKARAALRKADARLAAASAALAALAS
ncbi:hypothetical protein [Muricoccus vinaceus]|uniref:Uncharacterized protein n=1 Tax=Muricoccus vinaceus TaxID=424704 RepID=A0ABV6J0T4_9PROT